MRIRLDLNGCLSTRVGAEGLDPKLVRAALDDLEHLPAQIEAQRSVGRHGYLDLARGGPDLDAIERFTAEKRERFDALVVVGIGGSALGNTALHAALNHPYMNLLAPERRLHPRVFVTDNVDPERIARLLDVVDPARALFNVVTKSGETAETLATFAVFLERLRAATGDRWREHVVVTTDPKKGTLRDLAAADGLASFAVPPPVGGRFSVLSAVGLLSAAFAGIDIRRLVAGAASAVEAGLKPRSAALAYAVLIERFHRRGKPIAVFMPYGDALAGVADWWRQLLAESLGKRRDRDGREVFVGPTPFRAIGATDQHSQLQLFTEGPRDKWLTFVEVERHRVPCPIPPAFPGRKAFAYLAGRDLALLLDAEKRGTEIALAEASRPTCTFRLPAIDEETVGALLYTLALAVTYAGELFGVDAYDQPGVEASKVATYALMEREGYADRRAEMERRLVADPAFVL